MNASHVLSLVLALTFSFSIHAAILTTKGQAPNKNATLEAAKPGSGKAAVLEGTAKTPPDSMIVPVGKKLAPEKANTGKPRDAKKNSEDDTEHNGFGAEDREALTVDSGEWLAIGKLSMGCTGTLVARDYVLTAAHCVIDPNTKELTTDPIVFYPNYKYGTSVHESPALKVWWGTNDPDKYRGADWAIVELAHYVGDVYGWLGTEGTTVDSFPDTLTVAGYSTNFYEGNTAGVHHNCSTMKRLPDLGFIYHDCDTARGSSGGPALRMRDGRLTVYGVNVAEYRDGGETSLWLEQYSDNYANIVIPSDGAVAQLRKILGLDS